MRKLFLLLLLLPSCAAAGPATTRPIAGITYTHEVRKDPPLHLHILTIDLTQPSVHVRVSPAGADPDGEGPWETTLMTVRDIAHRDGLEVAVNGDFFMARDTVDVGGKKVAWYAGNWAKVCGLAMTDGKVWSTRQEAVALVVDDKGKIIIGPYRTPPPHALQVVAGSTQIVTAGKKTAAVEDRAPRTAAGIDAAGKVLTLVAVDGRRPDYSVGMTIGELADEMIRRGCHDAMNLDGGGSTTMVMRDAGEETWSVLNRPSDGHDVPLLPMSVERPVANVLGVRVDRPGTRPSSR